MRPYYFKITYCSILAILLSACGGSSNDETATNKDSPIISNSLPQGELAADIGNTELSLTTDKNATCRYSVNSGIDYDSMTNTFEVSGAINHTQNVTGLNNGATYTYYVRCISVNGDANSQDHLIHFSVQHPTSSGEEYVLFDFEDSVLHHQDWFLAQPIGSINHYVKPKSDSGSSALSLAVGEGRNGGNALLVESTDASMGLPGFWVLKGRNMGYHANLQDTDGYMLPRDARANRLEFWIRFEDGYRATSAAAQPPEYPNHQNMHVGTYQFDPRDIGGGQNVVESDNWHFYHQLFIRHDKARDGWIHVVLNQFPQHQRSLSVLPPNNSTKPAGNYWELLTRFYIDGHNYFSDPEIPYPVRMWVDDIKLTYVAEPEDMAIEFVGYTQGEEVGVVREVETEFPVTVRNNTASQLCGKITTTIYYAMDAELIDGTTGLAVNEDICLSANETRQMMLKTTPHSSIPDNRVYNLGVAFTTNDQILSDNESTARSLSDQNIERRWKPLGSHDAVVYSYFIRAEVLP